MDNFGNIRPHHWKGRFKISKIAKFESDLLKAYKDTSPQSREIYRCLYDVAGGGGGSDLLSTIQASINFYNFAELNLRSLKTYRFKIWQFS